jgi:hypothetical protein
MTNYFHNYIHRLRSFSELKKNIFFPALIAGFLFAAVSCEDPPSLIGSKLLPSSDFVEINSDLLKVKSFTMYRDSIPSSMPYTSFLGEIRDPYFGTTTCEFVSQVRLGAAWDETSAFFVDSVKLFLRLLTVSGDTADEHFLRIREIADVIYNDTTYYSSQNVALTTFEIPDISLPVLRADTINDLELKLDKYLAEYILRDTSKLKYTDNVDFRKYFRGLYFQMFSPNDPVLVSLSLASPTSIGYYYNYFEIYGHDVSLGFKKITLLLDAVSTNASFNLYRHDPTTAFAVKKLNAERINDTTYLDTLSYAQQFNGVYTRLVLSNLDSVKAAFAGKKFAVNKARLKIPVVYEHPFFTRSTIPSSLYLGYLTTDGTRYYVPESTSSFFDGTPDTTSTSEADDVYNLNIASFVQRYFEDKTNGILPELELFLSPTAGKNVILKANDISKPVKFEFTYTEF